MHNLLYWYEEYVMCWILRYFLGSKKDAIHERHLFSIDFAEDTEIFQPNSSSDRQVFISWWFVCNHKFILHQICTLYKYVQICTKWYIIVQSIYFIHQLYTLHHKNIFPCHQMTCLSCRNSDRAHGIDNQFDFKNNQLSFKNDQLNFKNIQANFRNNQLNWSMRFTFFQLELVKIAHSQWYDQGCVKFQGKICHQRGDIG